MKCAFCGGDDAVAFDLEKIAYCPGCGIIPGPTDVLETVRILLGAE